MRLRSIRESMSTAPLSATQVDLANIGLDDDILNSTEMADVESDQQQNAVAQQQMQKDLEDQRRKVIEPQIDQLRKTMDSIDSGVMQHKGRIKDDQSQTNDMSREVVKANSNINSLAKSL